MDTYGTDATSRALIRYYYPKYEANKILTIYSGSTMVLTSGLAGLVVLTFGSNLLTLLIAIALGTAAYIAAGIFVVSGIFLLLKSRKRLYRLLQQYQQSGKLPHHTSRKKPFLRLLKQEQLRK